MFIFSPARKKRLRTNTGCFPAEWLNQTSREARRRKERLERAQERKAKKITVTGTATTYPPQRHGCPTERTKRGNRYNSIHGKTGR